MVLAGKTLNGSEFSSRKIRNQMICLIKLLNQWIAIVNAICIHGDGYQKEQAQNWKSLPMGSWLIKHLKGTGN